MKIESINNYNTNKTGISNFKGNVSPEFIQYVDTLRKDCFKTMPQYNMKINNICNSIIEQANTVMEKCFHSLSVLSIDKTRVKEADTIIIPNGIITKYTLNLLPDAASYVNKESLEPIQRLRQLQICINGNDKHYSSFLEAFSQNIITLNDIVAILENCADDNCDKDAILKSVQDWLNNSGQGNDNKPLIDILKGCGNYQGALEEILGLLEFGQKHVDILGTYYDCKQWKIFCGQAISELKQRVEKLINIVK